MRKTVNTDVIFSEYKRVSSNNVRIGRTAIISVISRDTGIPVEYITDAMIDIFFLGARDILSDLLRSEEKHEIKFEKKKLYN